MDQITPENLRKQFIGWQCRIRQYAVRKNEGKLSTGVRPELKIVNQNLGPITVQLVKSDSEDDTREFNFMMQKTQDPQARQEDAIKVLSEYFYQIPDEFDEELIGVFSLESDLANQIVDAKTCVLDFEQGNQGYHLTCATRALGIEESKYQATYWHNSLFNPAMPGVVSMVGFMPDWGASKFESSGA